VGIAPRDRDARDPACRRRLRCVRRRSCSRTVWRAPIGGGSGTAIVGGLGESGDDFAGGYPTGIAVDAGTVYWSAADTVSTAPTAGGSPDVIASGAWAQQGFALDATRVYWSDFLSGQLMAVPRAGGPIAVLVDDEAGGAGIAVDATAVYFTSPDGVYRAPL
jgi:sugar lactone lactonase YvrE